MATRLTNVVKSTLFFNIDTYATSDGVSGGVKDVYGDIWDRGIQVAVKSVGISFL
jgi:hypothetical protein